MSAYLTDKHLSAYGVGSLITASFFLSPAQYAWGVAAVVAAGAGVGYFLKNQWVQSEPNQWLVVIRNGKMHKAGVGMRTLIGLTDSFVKFPSRVEQISFQANNVTKEMQGVIITGFAFWSVYREGDGPFRCYKYMEGGDANRNVQAMCESVLRNLIANSSLGDVMRNRNALRDNIKKDLKDQFKGWGIWLETVEITEVTISSERLFKDLQAQYRQQVGLKAQQIEMSSQEQINDARQTSELKMNQANELNETKKQTTRNNERIKRDQLQADYDNSKNDLQLKRIERQGKFKIQKMKNDIKLEEQRIANEQELSRLKQDFEIESEKRAILELGQMYDEKTLQKYQIDVTQRIYNRLGIRQIKINQFSGDNKNSIASVLPQLGYGLGQLGSANS